MHTEDAARERKLAAWSITFTGVSIPFQAVMFFEGYKWPVLMFSLAFMSGYIVERLRLCRTIVSLIKEREVAPTLQDGQV